jgi:N-carbamoylputrescine amidase
MRKVKIAAIQMNCNKSEKSITEILENDQLTRNVITENIQTAEYFVREAAKQGANIILLPELFELPYFCQEKNYEYYRLASKVDNNLAVGHFKKIAKELGVVIPISFFERDINTTYNSIAMIDSDGEVLGVYRKIHIPDDHFYQEKFYFTPGNLGFKVWETAFGKIGVGICWDQWFPESARSMANLGAEILMYPTAIGSEPIIECDSMPHWRRCMQGHAGSNLMPLVAANRVGNEMVSPNTNNNMQESSLNFYGSSFITDEKGEIVDEIDRMKEGFIIAEFDLDNVAEFRNSWGIYRDRRPETYII